LSHSTTRIDSECVNEVVYWVQCVKLQLVSSYLCNEQTCSDLLESAFHTSCFYLVTMEVYQKTYFYVFYFPSASIASCNHCVTIF